jgi:hypothetical protein
MKTFSGRYEETWEITLDNKAEARLFYMKDEFQSDGL